MKTLSERLAEAMTETGFESQTKLAKASGVEQSAISKILAGASKTSKHSGKLALAMGISADWLINGAGSMYGGAESAIQKIDVSKLVKVYDEKGYTGEAITWLAEVPDNFRAYIMKRNTGIAQAPVGSVVVVNPDQPPSTNDLVVTIVSGSVSVFRYHISGDGGGFLSVDDPRVPLSPVRSESDIAGPIIQIFIPELSK
ncbi:helix-turn-helix domain-containing protein [Serratia fonticola]|uniref:Helix-turn-helix domain-containing protein n=1 Tax=Serratia fonticola TaxID=47917 RepID=A0AAJ1YI83_SERFO|nr:helix-turn-helix domain-containing protein [Serratia fonticola]MDQ9129722.1 helix-turn-helix domain-containing protein [Serratia fonticola]